ncbi:MAG: tRNA (guanosine(37)-N1)-methyltransferase TrmD [Candidatus Omnitrophota bacterium]|nr:tRNA (guanosine(37)-N1)-methyltransferase TrmD [Candidatus Omnitrophota bacterium]
MQIDILTLFPKMFNGPLSESIVARAVKRDLVRINIHNLRDFTEDKHRVCDDKPYGGGPGMLMKPEPIFRAVGRIKKSFPKTNSLMPEKIIFLTPQGKKLNQKLIKIFSRCKHLILICGHYEGIDERVRKHLITDEISIGDYITTGGELPAMVLIDSIIRLIPSVLGNKGSSVSESFQGALLDYPQYTRPAVFRNMKVPFELLKGNHAAILKWRQKQALKRTKDRRPDLLKNRRI